VNRMPALFTRMSTRPSFSIVAAIRRCTARGFRHGQSALCRPQVDLKGQGVAPRLAVEDPRKRRVRHRAAVPVVLAVDLHGGKAGRQGAGGHEVVRPQPALGAVEIDQVAAAHVHRGDALIEMPASRVGRIPASCRPS
jgi:hypothetical protein